MADQTILTHPDVEGTHVVPSTDPDVLAAYESIGWKPVADSSLSKDALLDIAAKHNVPVDPAAPKSAIVDALNAPSEG